jgi:hypothetical protein
MLAVSQQTHAFWSYDNLGANPSATIGTSVTPGASNAQGSWTQLASSANIAEDVYGLYIQVHTGNLASNAKLHLLDIGVDPAGGTSYSAILQDMAVGASPPITSAGKREFFFPIFIPAGSAVAARIRGGNATAGTVYVAVCFYGRRGAPEMSRVGSFSETLGATTASTAGTSVTPGNAADGSWVDLGATTKDLWWWQLGHQISNTTITAEYTYLEVAFGDASNKTTIFKVMHIGTTSETSGQAVQSGLLDLVAYCPVKAGEHIYVRARCSDAPDTGYQVTVTGIGG